MDLNPSVAPIIRFQFAMIAFNHVVQYPNLSVFNVRRADRPSRLKLPGKPRDHGRALLSVLMNRGICHFFTLLDFTQNRYAAACFDGRR